MADRVSLHIEVIGLDAMQETFERGEKPVGFKAIGGFEKTFAASFEAVQEKTHVQTGYLRASGLTTTHFDGTEWEAEMSFARYPGIFELARGDAPTKSHPEGGHFFFNAVELFFPEFDDGVDGVFRAMFDESAPI